MKIWRLISGILSMVSFLIITFQSCATGVVNVLEDNNHDTSDVAGFFVALGLLVAGTVATILWKNASKGGDISLIVIYGLTAFLGFVNLGTFSDLAIWSSWALFCAIMAGVALYLHSQEQASDEYESGYAVPQMPSANIARKECPNCHAINEVGSLFCSSCGYRFPVQTFCKNCGKQLKPGNTFCTNCGTKCD